MKGDSMEEIKYYELDYWGWECPKCKVWNETQEDPSEAETVFCEGCGCEFIPIPE